MATPKKESTGHPLYFFGWNVINIKHEKNNFDLIYKRLFMGKMAQIHHILKKKNPISP
jgi:hypothetical protein